jgi:putative redox protein
MSSEPITTAPGSTKPTHGPASADTQPIHVVHRGGDRFDISVRGHVIRTDQPASYGGEDTGPTPTELFIASLAGCVAFYARRYLDRHNLPTEGLAVEADFRMGSRPARVARIEVRLTIPADVPVERREALLAVATHCTVHNSLITAPEISLTLANNVGRPTGNP